ncbi:PREDICTED: very-long-chain enoyl-CoA reductase-like [Amphimedon queenslandica]|uniref:very-long-chain enoyl-CoA reductase n=1 Tax=Amphimedon queenslandica TaxID=400682 RepID=A0A1X7V3X8_AMPQE|nr:PREDICTED: very-long-chain enoyl-CoA reductase-like [Amphimedon queenslandica]|eukprot:XP_003385897.1 PREDICTED: very-long-chain enoyl-CoA reductase-like [Amphimedon queenslandica]
MKIEVKHLRSGKTLQVLNVTAKTTIAGVKELYARECPKYYPDRQQYKISQEKGAKALKDEETISSLKLKDGSSLYFKDLGPQLGWSTVFLCEYSGPLFVYLLFYLRPSIIYGPEANDKPMDITAHVAAGCWTFHYAKRIAETLFVHRFSHSTMPIRNLFKNCGYYWSFAAFVSYFVNHPLYTPPYYGMSQIFGGLVLFVICQIGNFSSHFALRNLRPPGTKERRIPYPTSDPFTFLFNFVSCPNYTYEGGAWIAFTFMTQCLPAFFFFLAGFYQMTVWAMNKHRAYRKEFKDYPRNRKSIVPFLF